MNSIHSKNSLPRLSVLVIHYKRTDLAINAISSIKRLGLDSIEYILSDDGTPNLSLEELSHHFDTIIVSTQNKGLGHNMNQAVTAARGKYLLVMQEDTEFTGNKQDLEKSMAVLDSYSQIEMIRFYGSWIVDSSEQFIECKNLPNSNQQLYILNHKHPTFSGDAYSDMPHIRRNPCDINSDWMYLENARMEASERDYINRFLKRDAYIAFLYPNNDLIIHKGQLNSHRTSQWDYVVAKAIKNIADKAGIN